MGKPFCRNKKMNFISHIPAVCRGLAQWVDTLGPDPTAAPTPWYGKCALAAALLLLGWIGYWTWSNQNDFRITVAGGVVKFTGRFPPNQRGSATEFLLRDVSPAATIHVIGNWSPRRVLRIRVTGRIPPGDQQRIRNFMKMLLKG